MGAEYKELFALQDEITMDIMSNLNLEMTGFQLSTLSFLRPRNLEAYEHWLRGMHYHLSRKKEDIPLAHQEMLEAVKIDPNFGPAYRILSLTYCDEVIFKTTKDPEQSLQKAVEMVKKAFDVDPDYPPYTVWSQINRLKRNYDEAILNATRGIEQEPNEPYRYYFLSLALRDANLFKDSIPPMETALQLARFRPDNFLILLAWCYFGDQQFSKAIGLFEEILNRSEKSVFSFLAYLGLAASYEFINEHAKAVSAAENAMRINPRAKLDYLYKNSMFKDGPFKEAVYDSLRKTGFK